jgi:hypothetical protein
MEKEQKLYSTTEVAKELGVSAGHMRNLIMAGNAHPKHQIGRNWVFDLDEIERLRTSRNPRGRPKKK